MMKNLSKRIITILMILILATNGINFAQSELDLNQKVKVLDDINIFKGDGTGYSLDRKLKRSEAAILVVKLMGKYPEVSGSPASYSSTTFTDVKKDEWYAPYVGYCSKNNIIKGFPDNTFKPDEFITEKAFTQLVLGVLGYKPGVDFDWDTVLKFSLEVGLSTDLNYAFKDIDNVMYNRGDAVSLMHKSLTIYKKGVRARVIDDLIKSGMTGVEVARAHNLYIEDKIKTEIKTVASTSKNTIRVTFNEKVSVNQSKISLKEGNNEITISSVNKLPDFIEIITTQNLSPSKTYDVTINEVEDEQGILTDNLKGSTIGYEEPRIVSPYFKISKIESIASDRIKVYFTQPIDDSASQVLLYEFYNGNERYFEGSFKTLTAVKDGAEEDAIILTTNGYQFDIGREYNLKIKGDMKSTYGAYLNKGEGDAMVFKGVSAVADKFEIVDANFYDKDLVKIKFSSPVDFVTATNTYNYRLINNKNNMELLPSKVYISKYESSDNTEVIIRFSNTRVDYDYSIKVNEVYDSIKVSKTSGVINVGQGINDTKSPEILAINPLDRTSFEMIFDMRLKKESETASITISNGVSPRVKVIDETDPTKMIVYVSKSRYIEDGKEYKVTVNGGIVDELERRQKYSVSYTFPGYSLIEEDTRLEKAYFISQNLVMAKFNRSIRETDFSSADKFEYLYREGNITKTLFPSSVKVIDSKTVVLGFDYYLNGGTLELIAKDYYNITGETKYTKSKIVVDGM